MEGNSHSYGCKQEMFPYLVSAELYPGHQGLGGLVTLPWKTVP